MLAADPTLANLRALAPNVEWMNGVQFYLRRDVPTAHGHVIHIDTEWALTSISQTSILAQHVRRSSSATAMCAASSRSMFRTGRPGIEWRPAMQCSREEVVRETWNQLKRSVNVDRELLRDEDLHSWFLDPDIDERSDALRAS